MKITTWRARFARSFLAERASSIVVYVSLVRTDPSLGRIQQCLVCSRFVLLKALPSTEESHTKKDSATLIEKRTQTRKDEQENLAKADSILDLAPALDEAKGNDSSSVSRASLASEEPFEDTITHATRQWPCFGSCNSSHTMSACAGPEILSTPGPPSARCSSM